MTKYHEIGEAWIDCLWRANEKWKEKNSLGRWHFTMLNRNFLDCITFLKNSRTHSTFPNPVTTGCRCVLAKTMMNIRCISTGNTCQSHWKSKSLITSNCSTIRSPNSHANNTMANDQTSASSNRTIMIGFESGFDYWRKRSILVWTCYWGKFIVLLKNLNSTNSNCNVNIELQTVW